MDLSNLPPLSSERLLLRRPGHADVDAICALANNWEIARWMARLPFPYLREDAVFFLEQVVPREAAWIVQDRGSAEILGVGGLTLQGASGTVELGYWLGERHWGKEAGRAILGHAFGTLCLPEVASGCFAGNMRSARVLGKLGFRTIGASTRPCMAQARELPHLDMALARKVWASATGDA